MVRVFSRRCHCCRWFLSRGDGLAAVVSVVCCGVDGESVADVVRGGVAAVWNLLFGTVSVGRASCLLSDSRPCRLSARDWCIACSRQTVEVARWHIMCSNHVVSTDVAVSWRSACDPKSTRSRCVSQPNPFFRFVWTPLRTPSRRRQQQCKQQRQHTHPNPTRQAASGLTARTRRRSGRPSPAGSRTPSSSRR